MKKNNSILKYTLIILTLLGFAFLFFNSYSNEGFQLDYTYCDPNWVYNTTNKSCFACIDSSGNYGTVMGTLLHRRNFESDNEYNYTCNQRYVENQESGTCSMDADMRCADSRFIFKGPKERKEATAGQSAAAIALIAGIIGGIILLIVLGIWLVNKFSNKSSSGVKTNYPRATNATYVNNPAYRQ